VFLASSLLATAATIGGTLLYTIVSHGKQENDESQYASRAEMELVRNNDDDTKMDLIE
jgi:D-lactate dehydrogenase (cytochrome)